MSVTAVVAMGFLGALCGSGLYLVSKRYAVEMDERIDLVLEVLPGANCGACGFGSCAAFAGVNDCKEVVFLNEEGDKTCRYACIGHGTCARTCPFDAIIIGEDGLPIIDKYHCRGCGLCVKECPRDVLRLASIDEDYYVACSSRDSGKEVKKVCEIGCIACKICEKNCPVNAVHVKDNLALIDPLKCTGCGVCAEKCPREVILSM
jgi:electron transport complex protein RnfB